MKLQMQTGISRKCYNKVFKKGRAKGHILYNRISLITLAHSLNPHNKWTPCMKSGYCGSQIFSATAMLDPSSILAVPVS